MKMENYLIRSKTYLKKARKSTLERRSAICEILSENSELGYEGIHALLLKKGFKVGQTTVENDLATFKAAENYLLEKISREELERAVIPYRQKIYRDVLFLIQDGIAPEVSEGKPVEKTISEVVEMESYLETQETPLLPEKKDFDLLQRGQSFLAEVEILLAEKRTLATQLNEQKGQLGIESARRELIVQILKRVRGRFINLSNKANPDSLFRAVTRLGHEITILKTENDDLKAQRVMFEDRNVFLERENVFLKDKFTKLEESFEYQKLELEELQDWHDKLLSGFRDCSEDELNKNVEPQDFTSLTCSTEIDGKQYFFPTYCPSLNMPIELGDKFLETFCELSEEMRNRTIKAMKLLAKNGPAYPSLNNKKREVDGLLQVYVNKKYRIFWGIEKHKIIFYGVSHKNTL